MSPTVELSVGAWSPISMLGTVYPTGIGDASPSTADFFAAKGALETLLGALRVEVGVVRGSDPFLHPGRAARVLVGGEDAGWLGEIHPGVASEWDLGRVAGFELDLSVVLPSAGTLTFHSAVPEATLAWRWVSSSMVQSAGTGSRTTTVTASFLALRSTIS